MQIPSYYSYTTFNRGIFIMNVSSFTSHKKTASLLEFKKISFRKFKKVLPKKYWKNHNLYLPIQ